MRAIILAAGRGKRLRPLTNGLPKPLIQINGKALLEHQITALEKAGITEICINLHWLGQHIFEYINHLQLSNSIHWQWENPVLETGGAVARALPWLCQTNDEFIVTTSDIVHDFAIDQLITAPQSTLVLTKVGKNNSHLSGDFDITNNRVCSSKTPQYIFTGISKLHRDFFSNCPSGPFALFEQLAPYISKQSLGAIEHQGVWNDLGSWQQLDKWQWSKPEFVFSQGGNND